MGYKIDISNAVSSTLGLITDAEAREILGKGWSLSFVYSFQEIRDVYLSFCRQPQERMTLIEYSNRYIKDRIPFSKKPWDEKGRRLLEIKNALINFGWMDGKTLKCKTGVFEESTPGSSLSESDLRVFKELFFRYFRFQEYASLFISPTLSLTEKTTLTESRIQDDSGVLYYFGNESNRIDSFFYSLSHPTAVYHYPSSEECGKSKGGFIRFWDVFISWGSQLGLIERLNMKRQGYLLSNGKGFGACYFVNHDSRIDVHTVLVEKFNRHLLIDLSNLVMEICLNYRCSITKAQQAVIDYYLAHSDKVSLIRTSEIFIKETELNKNDRILYPKYKGSFISHIKLRKYD